MKRNNDQMFTVGGNNDACGTAFGMDLIGERWPLLAVRELMFGRLRFSTL